MAFCAAPGKSGVAVRAAQGRGAGGGRCGLLRNAWRGSENTGWGATSAAFHLSEYGSGRTPNAKEHGFRIVHGKRATRIARRRARLRRTRARRSTTCRARRCFHFQRRRRTPRIVRPSRRPLLRSSHAPPAPTVHELFDVETADVDHARDAVALRAAARASARPHPPRRSFKPGDLTSADARRKRERRYEDERFRPGRRPVAAVEHSAFVVSGEKSRGLQEVSPQISSRPSIARRSRFRPSRQPSRSRARFRWGASSCRSRARPSGAGVC